MDNLPKVAPEKFAKLETYIQKVYSQIGTINSEGGFYMPVDAETKLSKGYAFVEFSNPQVCRRCAVSRECCNSKLCCSCTGDTEHVSRPENDVSVTISCGVVQHMLNC